MIENLKKLRNRENISQQKLADIIGVSQQSINKYENHNIEPDIATLVLLADYFNTSIDYLVGHTDIERRIEKVYSDKLNEIELKHIQKYRKLTEKQKDSIDAVIENYSNEK